MFISSRGEVKDTTSTLQNAHAMISSVEYGGDESKVTGNVEADSNARGRNSSVNSQITVENAALRSEFTNKVCKQNKKSKGRKKMVGKNDMMIHPTAYHNWNTSRDPSGQLKNQLVAPIVQSSSSILRQQGHLGGSESLQYHQVNSPFAASFGYANVNLTNPCSSMPVPAHVQSAEFKHQSLLPGNALLGNQASVNKPTSTVGKGKNMTPQEKIEKLRRRQQMRARLAIQKQQQQFGHQAPSKDHTVNKRVWEDTQVQHSNGADVGAEDPSTLLDFELGSPLEQDDSITVSLPAKECGMEESVLFQLQDIIAKLDVRIRLCIRDSLFRLAQSAMHRNPTSNTSSTNICCKDKKPLSMQLEASCPDRNPMIPEEETKTNPIDRIVAHLLFHRPQELSGKLPGTPESAASSKYTLERESEGSSKHKTSFLSETEMDQQNVKNAASGISCLSSDPMAIGQQTQNVVSSEISENASNCRPADEPTGEDSESTNPLKCEEVGKQLR
ncbi:Protein LNK2 [Linum grandiflorum]